MLLLLFVEDERPKYQLNNLARFPSLTYRSQQKKLHTRNAEETENSARSEYSESIISKLFSLYEIGTYYLFSNRLK